MTGVSGVSGVGGVGVGVGSSVISQLISARFGWGLAISYVLCLKKGRD